MELFKHDLNEKRCEQLKIMEGEAGFIIESVHAGIKGIGEIMQVVDTDSLTPIAIKNLGSALYVLAVFADGSQSTQDRVRYRLNNRSAG